MTAQVESSLRRAALLISLSIYIVLWFGCTSSDVVPDSLEPQIDKSLTFRPDHRESRFLSRAHVRGGR